MQRAYTFQDVMAALNGDSAQQIGQTSPETVALLVTDDLGVTLAVTPSLSLPAALPISTWGALTYGGGYAWSANRLLVSSSVFPAYAMPGWQVGANWHGALVVGGDQTPFALQATRLNTTPGNGYLAVGAWTTPGVTYTVTANVRAGAANTYGLRVQNVTNGVLGGSVAGSYPVTTGWTTITFHFTATGNSVALYFTDDTNLSPTVGTTFLLDTVALRATNQGTALS